MFNATVTKWDLLISVGISYCILSLLVTRTDNFLQGYLHIHKTNIVVISIFSTSLIKLF